MTLTWRKTAAAFLGAAALLGAGATAATAAPGSGFEAIDGSPGEMRVLPVTTIEDLLETDRAIVIGGAEIRAVVTAPGTYRYYRYIHGDRHRLAVLGEVCIPAGPCHVILGDDGSLLP